MYSLHSHFSTSQPSSIWEFPKIRDSNLDPNRRALIIRTATKGMHNLQKRLSSSFECSALKSTPNRFRGALNPVLKDPPSVRSSDILLIMISSKPALYQPQSPFGGGPNSYKEPSMRTLRTCRKALHNDLRPDLNDSLLLNQGPPEHPVKPAVDHGGNMSIWASVKRVYRK